MRYVIFFAAYRVSKKADGGDELLELRIDGTAFDRDLGFFEVIVLFDMDLQCRSSSVL